MGTIDKRPLKAYVRFDGSGRIVAGSLILRRKMPKVGKWMEIPAYQCCNPTPAPPYPLSVCINRNGQLSTLNYVSTDSNGYPIYDNGDPEFTNQLSYSTEEGAWVYEGLFASIIWGISNPTTSTNVLDATWPDPPNGLASVLQIVGEGPCPII